MRPNAERTDVRQGVFVLGGTILDDRKISPILLAPLMIRPVSQQNQRLTAGNAVLESNPTMGAECRLVVRSENRENGANPLRSRRCNREQSLFIATASHVITKIAIAGRRKLRLNREPEDLPSSHRKVAPPPREIGIGRVSSYRWHGSILQQQFAANCVA